MKGFLSFVLGLTAAALLSMLNAALIARFERSVIFWDMLLPLTVLQGMTIGVLVSVCAVAAGISPFHTFFVVAFSVLVSMPTTRIIEGVVFPLLRSASTDGSMALLKWIEDNIFIIDGIMIVVVGALTGIGLVVLPKIVRSASGMAYP